MLSNNNQPKQSAFRRLSRKLSPKTEQKSSLSIKHSFDAIESSCCSTSTRNYSGDLQRVFNYFDENGDGRISAAELQRCLRMAGEELSMEDAEAAVESSDLNGDGHLDLEEFQKLMEGTNDDKEKKRDLREAFGMYVMDGSSFITPASLRRMLNRLGDSKSVDDCKAMIRAFDLNGDGVLSFDEFAIMMH